MLKVIHASTDNAQETADLFNQYRQFYGMTSDRQSSHNFITERLSKKDSIILLSINHDDAVGFVQVFRSFSSVAMRPIWILNDLFVKPPSRKLGCATLMIEALIKMADKHNIFSIKLSTAIDNHAAKSLYDRLGFTQISDFEHYSLLVKPQ